MYYTHGFINNNSNTIHVAYSLYILRKEKDEEEERDEPRKKLLDEEEGETLQNSPVVASAGSPEP